MKSRDDTLDYSNPDINTLLAARRKTRPCYIIDPRVNRAMQWWDMLTSFALVWTALVTPFEVALLEPPASWALAGRDALFLINRLIDLIFLVDMLLQFVTMIQSFSDRDGVKWIDEPKVIAKSYLRGWFTLDLVSLVPSAFDLAPLTDVAREPRWRPCGAWRCFVASGSASVLNRFKVLRVLRICRLIKLVRLLRASRMLRRWETRVSIHYATLSLTWAFLKYLVAAHWAACLVVLPTTFYEEPASTWLGAQGYCTSEPATYTAALEAAHAAASALQPSSSGPLIDGVVDGGGVSAVDVLGAFASLSDDDGTCTLGRGLSAQPERAQALLLLGECSVRCAFPGEIYVGAFFWALQMISGAIGYHQAFGEANTSEQCVFAVVCVMGALLWGHVIGTIVNVIANSNPDLSNFRNTLDALNTFMSVHRLPNEMRVRLREYFHQTRHVRRGQQRRQLLTLMSPQLQGEVCTSIYRQQLASVRFLRGAESELLVLIATSLLPAVFVPGELATPGHLYIIHKGVALYGGRVLTSGKVWGHDMILRQQRLCHFAARAMSYLEVYRLSRAELLELSRPFPIGWRKIRWEAFRLALIRSVVHAKKLLKAHQDRARQARDSRAMADMPAPAEAGSEDLQGPPSPAIAGMAHAPAGTGGRTTLPPLDRPPGINGPPEDAAWTNFMDSASCSPMHLTGASPSRGVVQEPAAGDLLEQFGRMQKNYTASGPVHPDAVERPSMGGLARAIERLREDVAEIRRVTVDALPPPASPSGGGGEGRSP